MCKLAPFLPRTLNTYGTSLSQQNFTRVGPQQNKTTTLTFPQNVGFLSPVHKQFFTVEWKTSKKNPLNYMVAHPVQLRLFLIGVQGTSIFQPERYGESSVIFGSHLRVMPRNILKEKDRGQYPNCEGEYCAVAVYEEATGEQLSEEQKGQKGAKEGAMSHIRGK